MTLGVLMIYIGIAAIVLTVIVGFGFKKIESWGLSFLQNFAGALFIFSGWVKAVDPLGTAYKMEQYFAEFEATFEATAVSFIAPLFPWLDNYVNGFSVFMIVLEIVLGVMLIIGSNRKLTAWVFFAIVGFFTFLTGFTYLTGYVPQEDVVIMEQDNERQKVLYSDVATLQDEGWMPLDTMETNFFKFKSWMDYDENNMLVTDCGCFGDFLKLEPRTSFLKDIFLLIPALIFLFGASKMHQLFKSNTRTAIVLATTLGTLVYCFSNYVWDIPHADFRDFKEGVNIYERKQAESEAFANREIFYQLKDLEKNKMVEIPAQQYVANLTEYSKEDKYEFVDQIAGEPSIPLSKISDFGATDFEGNEVGDELLQTEGYAFMLVAYKLYPEINRTSITVKDTSYVRDSMLVADTMQYMMKIAEIKDRQVTQETYEWQPDYLAKWTEKINPVMDAAQRNGVKVFALTKFGTEAMIEDFRHETQSAYPFYLADDILLKTIVRSNPGIVLMKDGTIVKKWHYRKLPKFDEIQAAFIQ